jgi:thioredoxin 1
MNVDENAIIPAEYAIRSIPSLFLVKEGQVIDSLVGNHPKEKIRTFIEQVL